MLEFLRGKILDVFPDYHKEAEDHLSKAVCNSIFLNVIILYLYAILIIATYSTVVNYIAWMARFDYQK